MANPFFMESAMGVTATEAKNRFGRGFLGEHRHGGGQDTEDTEELQRT